MHVLNGVDVLGIVHDVERARGGPGMAVGQLMELVEFKGYGPTGCLTGRCSCGGSLLGALQDLGTVFVTVDAATGEEITQDSRVYSMEGMHRLLGDMSNWGPLTGSPRLSIAIEQANS